MSFVDEYAEGVPCWVDLMTENHQATIDFYGGLFGWEFRVGSDKTNHYTLALLDGDPVAGIADLPDDAPIPTAWMTYFAVHDAGAASMLITMAAGPLSMNPVEITDGGATLGRMAMAADPAGAIFGVWEAGTLAGARRVNEPGTLIWNEAMSANAAAVRPFYTRVFGWTLEQIGDGVNFDYTTARVEDRAICGVMQLPHGVPSNMPSSWMTYFATADTDASVLKVIELGGEVVTEPKASPYGRFAMVQDPQGAVFALLSVSD